MGPTGNLQGLVKFFCLNTGRILKRRSFTALPMPDRVIKRVNAIGVRKRQGWTFRFLNWQREPYEWTDSVPEDDPEFQGLLEDEEEAAYPDISAEPPGVELESEEADFSAVTDDPEPDFEQLAAAALDNAGINPQDRLHAAQAAHTAAEAAQAAAAAAFEHWRPALVEANQDKIMYEIVFDLPVTGRRTYRGKRCPSERPTTPRARGNYHRHGQRHSRSFNRHNRRYPHESTLSVAILQECGRASTL